MPDDSRKLALAMVVLATIGLAFKGVFARFAYAEGMTVAMLLVLRFAIATPFFWVGAWMQRERSKSALTAADYSRCVAAGGLFFVSAYCDFSAIALLGAALSRIVLFTFPALVILLQAARERRAPAPAQLAVFGVAYAGLLLVLAPRISGETAADWRGIGYAQGAALSYAVFFEWSQHLTRRVGSVRFNAIANSATMLVVLTVVAPLLSGVDYGFSVRGLGWVAVIATVCTALPFFLLYEGIRRYGASRASLVTLLGPGVTIVAAYLFLGEQLAPLQWLGFGVVSIAVAGHQGLLRVPRRTAAASP